MSEITQLSPILTVVEDGSEYIIQTQRPIGKRLGSLILSSLADATRVTYSDESGIKVFKANGKGAVNGSRNDSQDRQATPPALPPAQEARPPRIIQDAAAPPAQELVEEDYEAALQAQEREAAEVSRQEQFNSQQALPTPEPEEAPAPRKPRNLNVGGSPCGRCVGSGKVVSDAGFEGSCPVCKGKGTIQSWGRGRK